MKDKFINLLDRIYLFINRVTIYVTYIVYGFKKAKNCPKLTKEEKKQIRTFWRKYKIRAPMSEYRLFKEITGKVNPKVVPDLIWHFYIEPYFNHLIFSKAFKDKNYFETIIGKENAPVSVLHCVNGSLLDENYCSISSENALNLLNRELPLICKPSIDSGGGRNIMFFNQAISMHSFCEIASEYRQNFIVQKVISQHEFLSVFNPTSVNTIRIVSLLFRDKVHVLSAVLRVGGAGSKTDNITAGGYYIPVDRQGNLKDMIFQKNKVSKKIKPAGTQKISVHYSGQKIPYWETILEVVEKNHVKLSHFGIINWDFAISETGKPIIIEYNLMDSSPGIHQAENVPILGELTDAVLDAVFHNRTKRENQ